MDSAASDIDAVLLIAELSHLFVYKTDISSPCASASTRDGIDSKELKEYLVSIQAKLYSLILFKKWLHSCINKESRRHSESQLSLESPSSVFLLPLLLVSLAQPVQVSGRHHESRHYQRACSSFSHRSTSRAPNVRRTVPF